MKFKRGDVIKSKSTLHPRANGTVLFISAKGYRLKYIDGSEDYLDASFTDRYFEMDSPSIITKLLNKYQKL